MSDSRPMLDVRDVTVHYGRIQALREISLHIHAGELVALVGNNGAGKSTLLHAICGIEPLSGGTITFEGEDLRREGADRRVRRGIAQVPEARQVFGPMTVEDNLMMGGLHPADARGGSRSRRDLRDIPDARRTAGPIGGNAVGRPAADAGHRARHDGQAAPVADGRTQHGPGAEDHRRDLRHHSFPEDGGHDRFPWSNRTPPRPWPWPTAAM